MYIFVGVMLMHFFFPPHYFYENTNRYWSVSDFRADIASSQCSAQVFLHTEKHVRFHHISNVLI